MKEVTGSQLKELIASGKTVVCDFWAVWCGPCRMLAPVLEKVASEFEGRCEFVKCNVDSEAETAAEFGIMSIPDVFVFADGKLKDHNLGYADESEMRAFIQKNL